METKQEIIQRLFDKGQITFSEALILAESVIPFSTQSLQIFGSMDEVFNNTGDYTIDPDKTNIT